MQAQTRPRSRQGVTPPPAQRHDGVRTMTSSPAPRALHGVTALPPEHQVAQPVVAALRVVSVDPVQLCALEAEVLDARPPGAPSPSRCCYAPRGRGCLAVGLARALGPSRTGELDRRRS
jgi:hypothetical protein